MLLGVGAVATKTYVDDVFSTYLYTGTGNTATHQITNGVDLSGEGGMTWIKARNQSDHGRVWDTERGNTKTLMTASNYLEQTATYMSSFNNNGFTLGGTGNVFNSSSYTYASWSFRKAPGFFDVVTYTGNGGNQSISHSLGCVPGLIMVKCTSEVENWAVYHRNTTSTDPETKYLVLNTNASSGGGTDFWNNTKPTANSFSVGHPDGSPYASNQTNGNNKTYVAYVFAGGESTAATARSVDFDGSGDYLKIAASSDLDLDGDFTIEAWVNVDDGGWSGTRRTLLANSTGWATNHAAISLMNSASSGEENAIILYNNTSTIAYSGDVRIEPSDGWTHIAITRDSSNKIRIFKNGIQAGSTVTNSEEFKFGTGETWVGAITMSTGSAPEVFDGKISNLRVIKGTALYTSAFRPPTEPLTNVTNTKLLCCNNSSTTGSTVTSGTITTNGDPTASTDSPFDDPAGFVFGDAGDQNVIKCGSYIGNGSTTGPEINLGWEPQWLLCKKIDNQGGGANTSNWHILDSMRGTASGGAGVADDQLLMPNLANAEVTIELADFTSTGFKNTSNRDAWNYDGDEYLYVAIRRPDGYCGKLPELGTDVFAMDTGKSGTPSWPNQVFDSNFPVDFALVRKPAVANTWYASNRMTSPPNKALRPSDTDSEIAYSTSYGNFDSNTGWSDWFGTDYQSWMWKRHAGFDVVTDKGNGGTTKQIAHNLNAVPQMIWRKNRDGGNDNWQVYHIGLNGGTNPHLWRIYLDTTNGNTNDQWTWDSAPTATHFTVGSNGAINRNGDDFITMLFASVDKISKVGYYTGNGSTQTITTGFAPRFAIIRRVDGSEDHWLVLDTTRGWASGNDKGLKLNSSDAQGTSEDYGAPTSTGFSLTSNGWVNYDTGKFIYYAHA